MFKIFSKLYQSRELACFYNDYESNETFYVGYIVAFNKTEIAIQLISVDGADDEIIVINIDNIFRVETEGKYIEKIKKLIPFSQINDFSNALDEIEIYKSLLKFAYDKRGIVSIELNSSGFSDVVGFVEDINKDVCSINQIDEYGFDDGHSYIKIDDITEISYSRIKEKRLIRLWNFNKNTGDGSSC